MFSDDARIIHDLLEEEWDTGLNDVPTFTYLKESQIVNARIGNIHVKRLTLTNRISTTDYRTVNRNSYISVKVSCRFRDRYLAWCEEIYRIVMENRRSPAIRPWGFMEIMSERDVPDLSGWYSHEFDIRLTRYAQPIRSHGFGRYADQFKCLPDGEGADSKDTFPEADRGWTGGEDDPGADDPCDIV